MKKRVKLIFPKRSVHMPITYRLAKDFNIAANIIRAQVAPNQVGHPGGGAVGRHRPAQRRR
jgi:hypothetical protein